MEAWWLGICPHDHKVVGLSPRTAGSTTEVPLTMDQSLHTLLPGCHSQVNGLNAENRFHTDLTVWCVYVLQMVSFHFERINGFKN